MVDLAFSDAIITVVVAVISSLGAVILSAFLAQYLSERKEKRRSRSLVATCLELLYIQSPAIENYFSMLTGPSDSVSWTEASLPLLFDLSSRTRPYEIPFDKARENLLSLEADLADMIVKLDILVRQLNRWLIEDTEGPVGYSSRAKVSHTQMLGELQKDRKVNQALAEYVNLLAFTSKNWRQQLFAGEKKITVDWKPLDAKLREVDNLFVENISLPSPPS